MPVESFKAICLKIQEGAEMSGFQCLSNSP